MYGSSFLHLKKHFKISFIGEKQSKNAMVTLHIYHCTDVKQSKNLIV